MRPDLLTEEAGGLFVDISMHFMRDLKLLAYGLHAVHITDDAEWQDSFIGEFLPLRDCLQCDLDWLTALRGQRKLTADFEVVADFRVGDAMVPLLPVVDISPDGPDIVNVKDTPAKTWESLV